MRTLPIHLDRLDAALKAKGVTLKRHSLLEVAAAAFGHHNQNQLTAAAREGGLDPSPANALGTLKIDERTLLMLEDEQRRPFAIDADAATGKTGAFAVSPYGGLVDLRHLGDVSGLPRLPAGADAAPMHFASISHEYGANLYCAPTEADLRRKIADWCREYWVQEGVEGTYEGLSDEEVCDAYFEQADEDGVTYYATEDVSLSGHTAPSRSEPYVPEGFAMRSDFLLSRTTGDVDEPFLYWSSKDGWGDPRDATVFDAPLDGWPEAGVDQGSLFVVPLPTRTTAAAYPNRDGKGLDIVFLTNRDCDVQGPAEHAEKAMPWLSADEIEVGMGPQRTAEIGYSALVDGKIYLAPTIKAFHFDAEDSVRAMMENRDELQEHAEAIESAIKAVSGMVMLEEDSEAVTLTVFIPLSEAKQASSLEDWREALEDLLTPGGSGERVMATFRPQTSIGDSCYDADCLDDDGIDVTYEVKLMGEDAARMLYDHEDEAESLKDALRAPEWVREWMGPFGIEVRRAVADYYGFDADD